MATAIENLEKALETYRERNKLYGDNYKHFGEVMCALFPKGLRLYTTHDWNRFGVLIQIISKLTRYTQIPLVGHQDSIHDMIVYSAMLEELDAYGDVGHTEVEFEDSPESKAACPHVYVDDKCTNCGEIRAADEEAIGTNFPPIAYAPHIHHFLNQQEAESAKFNTYQCTICYNSSTCWKCIMGHNRNVSFIAAFGYC